IVANQGLVARDVVVDVLPCLTRAVRHRVCRRRLTNQPRTTSATCSCMTTAPLRPSSCRTSLSAWQPLELFSMKRFELPAPSSGQVNDITAYQECVNNSMAQRSAMRIENLKLMSQHGCNAWTLYKERLVHMIEHALEELQKLRKNIQDLNWQRKNVQLTAGAKLQEMESAWVSLVSKNHEIAIVQLENEISQTKQQHGEANKENFQQDFQ
uniref:Pre-mRNA-splicing factor SPF27 n=1 Tax=Junco hyemalis TaxID=40217 RepID=A0A8C5NQR3_JUNHY